MVKGRGKKHIFTLSPTCQVRRVACHLVGTHLACSRDERVALYARAGHCGHRPAGLGAEEQVSLLRVEALLLGVLAA